jgi:hypothetical protein
LCPLYRGKINIEQFRNIEFDVAKAEDDGSYHGEPWKKKRQAKVLVKTHIPWSMIEEL